jgi:hypothetical protein
MRLMLALYASAFLIELASPQPARADTVWTGYTKSFIKPNDADPLLPQWQDHITGNVALSRPVFGGGLINVLLETDDNRPVSPLGTEWAYDFNNPGKTIAATNWQNLSFSPWVDSFGGNTAGGPAGVVGKPAVLHLIEDDVYLDFKLTAWTIRAGGGVSYLRAQDPTSADFNRDTLVDAADLAIWKPGFGASSGALNSEGDADFDADIDGQDFLIWQRTLKSTTVIAASSPAQSTIPEPPSSMLSLFAVLRLLPRCRSEVPEKERRS